MTLSPTRWLAPLVVSALVTGCDAPPDAKAERDPPTSKLPQKGEPTSKPAATHKATGQLKLSPQLAAAVDTLATHKTIESSHVGAGGVKSEVYTAYEGVAKLASDDQIRAIMHHESPVVRGYMAAHIARNQPSELATIYPMMTDETSVGTLDGCMGGQTDVATHTVDAVCVALQLEKAAPTRKTIRSFLERAGKDSKLPAAVRAAAADCLTRYPVKT